jgi:subtilisin family serine protease
MSRHTRRDVLRTAAAGVTALTFAGQVSGAGGATQYVVTATKEGVETRLERAGFEVVRSLAGGDVFVVEGSGDPARVRGVGDAVPNFRLRKVSPPVDASDVSAADATATTEEGLYEGFQWDKQVTDAAAAHDVSTGTDATLAIIDSGVDVDHPDLAPNVVPGGLFRLGGAGVTAPGETGVYVVGVNDDEVEVRVPAVPLTTLDQVQDYSGEEPVDVGYRPEDFETVSDRRVDDDVDGHGSHVAGIAAASVGASTPVGTGVAGMAPDASIISHRVFYWVEEDVTYEDDGGKEVTETPINQFTSFADILTAIDFAANTLGVDAMNLSIGTPPLPPQVNSAGIRQATNLVVRDAVNAGSVVVISAGNSATELNKYGLFTLPNSVPGAMSISATGPNDLRVFYSNYGTNEVDLGAPGGGYETLAKTYATDTEWPFPYNLVLSTVPPDIHGNARDDVAPDLQDAYAWFGGTSMAAPQVAGAAALVAAANPDLSATQVEQALKQGSEKATGQKKDDVGAGVLNALGAVEQATGAARGRGSGKK